MLGQVHNLTGNDNENYITSIATNIGVFFVDKLVEFVCRALLRDRVSDNDFVSVVSRKINIRGVDSIEWMRDTIAPYCEESLQYIRITNTKDIYNNGLPYIDTVLTEANYEQNEAASMFFKQHNVDARLYTNKDIKRAVIIANGISEDIIHIMVSLLPISLPWLFEDKPVTDSERELLKDIFEDDIQKIRDWANDYINKLDLKSARIKELLKGFTKGFANDRQKQLEYKIQDIDSAIASKQSAITLLFRDREQFVNELSGMLMNGADSNDDTELIDFILSSKCINLISASNGNLKVEIATPLDNFDQDLAEKYLKNPKSPFNNPENYRGVDFEDGKKLINEIFLTQRVKVIMRGMFLLDFRNAVAGIVREFTSFTNDCLDNPHITAYRCLGNNGPIIANALADKDSIMALSSCISVAGNLNIAEVVNDTNFLTYLFASRNNCIELPDGTRTTVSKAIQYLKENDNE